MKLKKHIMSALVAALSLIMVLAFVACGGDKDPKVTAIALNQPTVEIETGTTSKLTVTATYDDETSGELKAGDVTWASDNESVATVTRGIVSGKTKGTAKITATYGEFSATCNVTVNLVEVIISGYELNDDDKVELQIDGELMLSAKVNKNGEELDGETVVWSTSAPGIVSVANGVIKGINPGEATITATRANGTQSASITVVVPEIIGSAQLGYNEQNKTLADTWGFWNDQGYNWSNTTVYSKYTEPYAETEPETGYERIGAGKMNITFSVDSYGGSMAPGPHDAAIQLFYRSSKENGGRLEANHNYEIKLKVLSNTAGTIVVNPFDDIDGRYGMEEDNEEAHEALLEANVEKEITVQFRHGDSGAIYAQGKYTNVESAINILLGLLSAPVEDDSESNVVKVSVYDVRVKDLGESTYKWVDDETELEGYTPPPAVLPDLSGVDSIAIDSDSITAPDETHYAITAGTDNKSYDVVYTDVAGGNYQNVAINIPESANAAENNTFVVTIANNGSADIELRFDVAGATAIENGQNSASKDCAISSAASVGVPNTDSVWDGTTISIKAGETTTLYITYDATTGRGAPTQILVYFETHYWANSNDNPAHVEANYSGNVTLSEFKFANVVSEEVGEE